MSKTQNKNAQDVNAGNQGDNPKKAFVAMLEGQQRMLGKIISKFCKEKEDRLDLFQSITYQLWKSFSKFRMEATERTWAFEVAFRTACNYVGSKPKWLDYVSEFPDEIHPLTDEHPFDSDHLEKTKFMRDADKAIFELLAVGFSYQEISEILDLPPPRLRNRVQRLKGRLKKNIN